MLVRGSAAGFAKEAVAGPHWLTPVCTLVLNGLLHSLKEMKFNVGQQFEVVTVSFDSTEKPATTGD